MPTIKEYSGKGCVKLNLKQQADFDEFESELKAKILDNAGYFLAKAKSFYWKHAVPHMASRRSSAINADEGGKEVLLFDAVGMWEEFIPRLIDFVFECSIMMPSADKYKYTFTNGPRALYLIRNRPDLVELDVLTKIKPGVFIDMKLAARCLNFKITMNTLNDQIDIESQVLKEQGLSDFYVTLEDAILALSNNYDAVNNSLPDIDILETIKLKRANHSALKESYFQDIYKFFVSRNLKKAFDEDDIQERINKNITKASAYEKSSASNEDDDNPNLFGKLNKTIWNAWIREAVYTSAADQGVSTPEKLYKVLKDANKGRAFTDSVMSLLGLVITSSKLPFYYNVNESFYSRIKDEIDMVMIKYATGKNTNAPLFKELRDYAKQSEDLKEIKKRIKRMTKSAKTYLQLSELIDYDDRLMIDGNDGARVYNFLQLIKKTQINESTIRNFMKSVWPNPAVIVKSNSTISSIQHNFKDQGYRRAFDLVAALVASPAPKFHDHLFKLLTSVANGGKNTSSIIYELTSYAKLLPGLEVKDHPSIRHIITSCRRIENTEKIIKLNRMEQNGWVFDENDIEHTLDLGLIDLITETFSDLKIDRPNAVPIKERLDRDLVVGLYPYGHYKGLLGVGVEGVCIEPGEEEHFEHLTFKCLNLIVHDNDCIYMWGLVVPLEDGTFFLNNLQGGLSGGHKKQTEKISRSIVNVLAQNGKTYSEPHYFNAISIGSVVNNEEELQLKLPDMRLDTSTNGRNGLTAKKKFICIEQAPAQDHETQTIKPKKNCG